MQPLPLRLLSKPQRRGCTDEAQNNVFSNLMVISTSLAIGLILGFAIVHSIEALLSDACCKRFRLGICGQGCKCSSSYMYCLLSHNLVLTNSCCTPCAQTELRPWCRGDS